MSRNDAFRALADPTRRRILALLGRRERTAGDLAARFALSKPSLSHHFAVLKTARLVRSRREGQLIWYTLNFSTAEALLSSTTDLLAHKRRRP